MILEINISQDGFFGWREIAKELGMNLKPHSIVSKSDAEIVVSKSDIENGRLENKLATLDRRLIESEYKCSATNVQISDLLGKLGETNRSIEDLEKSNNYIKLALIVMGILFASSLTLTYFPHQSNDLFISCYVASENCLNSLLTNPLFDKLYVLKI